MREESSLINSMKLLHKALKNGPKLFICFVLAALLKKIIKTHKNSIEEFLNSETTLSVSPPTNKERKRIPSGQLRVRVSQNVQIYSWSVAMS